MHTTPFFCGKDCGGNACPLLATVEDGRVTRVANNPAGGKYLRGCARGFGRTLEQYAPDRIGAPLIRSGPRGSGSFREATWDEALGLTADRLAEIRARHGANAVMFRAGAGVTGALHGTRGLLGRFMGLFGGGTVPVGSYSYGAAQFILPYVLGEEWRVSGSTAPDGGEEARRPDRFHRTEALIHGGPRGHVVASLSSGDRCGADAGGALCDAHGRAGGPSLHRGAQHGL
jgi:anaerobic selenocysteine-containing dehydrogenase